MNEKRGEWFDAKAVAKMCEAYIAELQFWIDDRHEQAVREIMTQRRSLFGSRFTETEAKSRLRHTCHQRFNDIDLSVQYWKGRAEQMKLVAEASPEAQVYVDADLWLAIKGILVSELLGNERLLTWNKSSLR